MNWPFLITTVLIGSAIAFALGWEISVRRHRAKADQLQAKYISLRGQIDELTDQVSADPIQFGMRTGREYVIERVEQLVCTLRDEDA